MPARRRATFVLVDEALAELAEILQIEPSGYRENDLVSVARRVLRELVAKLADL